MSLLEQDTIRKRRVDEVIRRMKFDVNNNNSEEYKVEVLQDSIIYAKESELGHLLGFYYLVL